MAFVVCTGAAIVLSGSRPATAQGLTPLLAQALGYASAVLAGVLLVASGERGAPEVRRDGALVPVGCAVLVAADLWSVGTAEGGANIGAGLVRLLGLGPVTGAALNLVRRTRRPN